MAGSCSFRSAATFCSTRLFAGVIQYRHLFGPHFLQNAVAESAEAQDIDIQDAIPVTAHDQILLGLHGELIRHNDQEIPARFLCRPLHDLFIDSVAFAPTRKGQNRNVSS